MHGPMNIKLPTSSASIKDNAVFVCVEYMGAADHWTPTLMSVMCSVILLEVRWSIWLTYLTI